MRIGNLVLAYFMIGAVMFGGGVISYEEAGVITAVVSNDGGEIQPAQELGVKLAQQDSVIGSVVSAFGGGILIAWNMIRLLLKFLNWPLVAFASNNAPPIMTILLGGGLTLSFYLGVARAVMSS